MAKTTARGAKAQWELITCIVQRGKADDVFKQAQKAGAGGATIHFGRGTGVRERLGLLGIAISPEKEVITILSPAARTEGIVDALVAAADLDTPGMGLLFVQPVHHVHGLPGVSKGKGRR
jgi:nitrogen regulatory protein PII